MSNCLNNEAVSGCYTDPTTGAKTNVVVHYVYDNEGEPAVRVTDIEGAVVAGADASNTEAGSCSVISPVLEQEVLCDVQADGSSVEFTRVTLTTFNVDGTIATRVSTDYEIDGTTAYTVTGDDSVCPKCNPIDDADRGLQSAW